MSGFFGDRMKKFISCLIVVTLIVSGCGVSDIYAAKQRWNSTLGKIQKEKIIQETSVDEDLGEDSGNIAYENMRGYINIALFGLDNRVPGQLGSGNRSDTIMVASINLNEKEIKLVSVYRDTYLDLTNGKYNKCNSAYSAGGPNQAISMLNKNLDLDIEHYISVDFTAVTKVIDLLGGVDIDVDVTEIEHLNNYIIETSEITGVKTTPLTSTGLQTLDGVQATSYCRIRYTDEGDCKRTERARKVLKQMFGKAKTMTTEQLYNIIVESFSMTATNYTVEELDAMALLLKNAEIVDTAEFPFCSTEKIVKGKGTCIIPTTLEENVQQLHEYLFENSYYQSSDEVKTISDQIEMET